jgi:hypothetical protein
MANAEHPNSKNEIWITIQSTAQMPNIDRGRSADQERKVTSFKLYVPVPVLLYSLNSTLLERKIPIPDHYDGNSLFLFLFLLVNR